MAFESTAQNFLREKILPDFESLLDKQEYVHRLLFREGVDVNLTRALRTLRDRENDNSDVLEDQELHKEPYLFLIGNAGAGKSLVLTFGYVCAVRRFLDDPAAPFPLFLDLKNDLPSNLDSSSLKRALEHRNGGVFKRALSEAPSGSALFLDGLDEVLRRSPHFINDLKFFFEDHKDKLKQVVIACRRAAWSPAWFARGPVKLSVYTADHLGQEEYVQILPKRTDRQAFFEQCDELRISALLETPFDGFYLAREFRAGRPLPKTRRECITQRVIEMLRGRDSDRQNGNATSASHLRFLSCQLACMATFTAQSSWSEQDAVDLLGSSEVIRSDQPIQPEEIQTLFQRPLFKRSDGRFTFIHQLYVEFLAAEALACLPLYKQQQLLIAPASGLNRIQTPLRGIPAFLAEISDPFCDYLILADCLVALFAEIPSLPRDKDEVLLQAVINDAIAKPDEGQIRQPQTDSSDPKRLSYKDQFRPLFLLMSDDDQWAWEEFAHRLSQDDVPVNEDVFFDSSRFRVPKNPVRLPILADWFAFICRKKDKDKREASLLSSHLREAIVALGGEKAIQELRRLQVTQAFPEAQWLSGDILRIEDRLLSEGSPTWGTGQLLDFLNTERFGVVLNERDLFRWVCQAIEEVKDALEQRGESVSGFWNGNPPKNHPKTEPECQNVLWPLLQLTLKKFSIATVEGEEKSIGPHWCDFWVEFPRKGESPFRVAVELKTARQNYGRDKLIEPVEEQLWTKYMAPTQCRHGIFIVLWFRDAQRYPWPALWPDRETFAKELEGKCREVESAHPSAVIVPYVIDMTAEFRRH